MTETIWPTKQNIFIIHPVTEKVCQHLLSHKELTVLDLRKLVRGCVCGWGVGVVCVIMQHMEWLNAFLGMPLCAPLMPLIILFDFNCVLGLIY